MPSTQILAVLDDLARVIGATTQEQDKRPTPCDGLDVISLRRHLLGGIQYFDIVLTDPDGDQRPDRTGPAPVPTSPTRSRSRSSTSPRP